MWSEMMDGRMIHQYLQFLHQLRIDRNSGQAEFSPLRQQISMMGYTPFLREAVYETSVEQSHDAAALGHEFVAGLLVQSPEAVVFQPVPERAAQWLLLASNPNGELRKFSVTTAEEKRLVEQAVTLLEETNLIFLPEIASPILVLSRQRARSAFWQGMIVVDTCYDPIVLAEAICRQAARSWMNLHYVLWGYTDAEGTRNPENEEALDVLLSCWESCIQYVFCERLSELLPASEEVAKMALRQKSHALEESLRPKEKVIKGLAAKFQNVRFLEMFDGYFPSPDRYSIYREG